MHCFWFESGSKLSCTYCNSGRLRDHNSMSRALMELHWLPVDKRIEYKLLLYMCKPLHGARVSL